MLRKHVAVFLTGTPTPRARRALCDIGFDATMKSASVIVSRPLQRQAASAVEAQSKQGGPVKSRIAIAQLCELAALIAAVLALPFVISCTRCEALGVGAFLLAVAAVASLAALALQFERPSSPTPKRTDLRKEPRFH